MQTPTDFLQEVLWRMERKDRKNQWVRDIPIKGPTGSTDQNSFGA